MSSATSPSPPSPPPADGGDKDRSSISHPDYASSDVKPIARLPPISMDKPFDTAPVLFYPPSPEFGDSEDDLPGALVHPDMPFNTVADLNAPRVSLPAPPISPPPTKPNRSSIAGSTSSDQTRDAVMEMMSMFSSSAPPRRRYTTSQIAQWRAEEEYYQGKIQEELGGKEICLIRYEPKHGWLGFWNKGNVLDIIDDLRELRSPKP